MLDQVLWHLGMHEEGCGLRSVEESTVAAARMLDWDGIRGLLTRCGCVGSWAPLIGCGVWGCVAHVWLGTCVSVGAQCVPASGGMSTGEEVWRQGLCSPRRQGLGQEAGGRRQEARAETDVCSGLLETEKCPLKSAC